MRKLHFFIFYESIISLKLWKPVAENLQMSDMPDGAGMNAKYRNEREKNLYYTPPLFFFFKFHALHDKSKGSVLFILSLSISCKTVTFITSPRFIPLNMGEGAATLVACQPAGGWTPHPIDTDVTLACEHQIYWLVDGKTELSPLV